MVEECMNILHWRVIERMLLRARVSRSILLLNDAHRLDWVRCSKTFAISSSKLKFQRTQLCRLVVTASNQESCMHEDLVDGCMPTARLSSHIFLVACAATCLAALSRTAFSVLALPIFDHYCLPSKFLGSLQATLLTGYLIGQVRAQLVVWVKRNEMKSSSSCKGELGRQFATHASV